MFEIKDNKEYEALYNAYVNAGGAEELTNGFTGQVAAGGAGGFEVGDHIDWPNEIKPLKVKVRNNTTQAFVVKVTNNGVSRYQLFYPSTLSKSIREVVVDAEGKVVSEKPFIRTLGTAAKWYQEQANMGINDTIKKMVAEHPKGLDVTKVDQVWTYRYQTKEPTQTTRYTIDFTV